MAHTKIMRALERFGQEEFCDEAKRMLELYPRHKVVYGLLGGPCRNTSISCGTRWPRVGLRYERTKGIVGIQYCTGNYLVIAL